MDDLIPEGWIEEYNDPTEVPPEVGLVLIISEKLGQLGNQMFQYVTVMGGQRTLGHSYCLFQIMMKSLMMGLETNLGLNCLDAFDINPERTGFVPGPNIQEKDFTFDPSLFEIPSDHDLILVGLFQTQRYFEHRPDEVRKEFKFRQQHR